MIIAEAWKLTIKTVSTKCHITRKYLSKRHLIQRLLVGKGYADSEPWLQTTRILTISFDNTFVIFHKSYCLPYYFRLILNRCIYLSLERYEWLLFDRDIQFARTSTPSLWFLTREIRENTLFEFLYNIKIWSKVPLKKDIYLKTFSIYFCMCAERCTNPGTLVLINGQSILNNNLLSFKKVLQNVGHMHVFLTKIWKLKTVISAVWKNIDFI